MLSILVTTSLSDRLQDSARYTCEAPVPDASVKSMELIDDGAATQHHSFHLASASRDLWASRN